MRFSLTTIWLSFKIRTGLTMLLLGVGVYLGMVHQVLVEAYWPGTQILGGIFFFLGLGFWVGIKSAAIFEKPGPLLKPFFAEHSWHPTIVIKAMMTTMAVAVLVSTVLGTLFTAWNVHLWDRVSDRFLIDDAGWKVVAFGVPMVPAGLAGGVLGFILGLCYMLLIDVNHAAFFHSNQRKIQKLVRNLMILPTLSVVTGGALGYFLTILAGERWIGVILIPIILSLLVILLAMAEKTDPSTLHHDPAHGPGELRRSAAPELASRTRSLTQGTVILLGWLGIWQMLHWQYAIDNWYDLGNLFGNRNNGSDVIFLAGFAAAGGIFAACRLFPKRFDAYLTPIDREGLSLAGLGLWTIVTAVLMKYSFKADYLQTGLPQIVIPLSLLGVAWLWGVSIGLILPAMTIGRPDSMEFWNSTLGRIGLGILLAGPTYMLWQALELGNLLAIALGALLAIAFGGVNLIYDEPEIGDDMRSSRAGRYIHTGCIIFLYLSLGFIILFVPPLQAGWLKTVNHRRTTVREGRAGAASLIDGDEPSLIWSGRFPLMERTDATIRLSAGQIADRIVAQRRKEISDDLRILLVNMPYRQEPWAKRATQVDLDSSIRELEFKMLGIDPKSEPLGITELYTRPKGYSLSITLLPPSWQRHPCRPARTSVVRRVLRHTKGLDGVWILLLTRSPEQQANREAREIEKMIEELTGTLPANTTIEGPMDYRWQIFSSQRSIEEFTRRTTLIVK